LTIYPSAQQYSPPAVIQIKQEIKQDATPKIDLGWKQPETKKKSKGNRPSVSSADLELQDVKEEKVDANGETKHRILKELSARLARDKQMGYAQRELEMQRLMMGEGAKRKIQGVEKVEGDSEEEDDEDEIDARRGKFAPKIRKVDETTYKPRVYKWRMERKR
jgi:U3 small nucleolar RNA-associated protein 11